MNARISSILPFTALLCVMAWAAHAQTPEKTRTPETAIRRTTETSAEEKASQAAAKKALDPEADKKSGVNAVAEAVVKKPPQPALAASAEVSRLIRSGQYEQGRAVFADYQLKEPAAAQRVDVALTYGNELMRATRAGKAADPTLYGEAKRQFGVVIKDGAPAQQLIARNNLASINLDQGDSAAALKVFDEGYATAKAIPEPAVRSQYLFNYAQALERAPGKQGRNAADLYREAFIADPRRREAADAGLKLTLSQRNIARAAEFAQLLIDRGHLELAEKRLREALDNTQVRQSPDAYLLVGSLMNLIAAQKVSPAEFGKRWDPYVGALGTGLESRAETMRKLLQLGYAAPEKIPQIEYSYQAREALGMGNLREPQIVQVSTYWTQIGSVRVAAGESRAAFSLYSIAWLVDRKNMDAALNKANMLLERREEIDPDGRVLDRMTDELFQGKGDAYLGEDWPAILRFHMILGTLYNRQKQWGDSHNPRGAVFQLEHAHQARKRLEGKEGGEPTPGLYTMLAECYIATKRPDLAYSTYQRAARDALDAADTDLASDIMTRRIAGVGGYTPTPEQSATSKRLEAQIATQRDQG